MEYDISPAWGGEIVEVEVVVVVSARTVVVDTAKSVHVFMSRPGGSRSNGANFRAVLLLLLLLLLPLRLLKGQILLGWVVVVVAVVVVGARGRGTINPEHGVMIVVITVVVTRRRIVEAVAPPPVIR